METDQEDFGGGGYDKVSEGKAGGVGRNQHGMRGEGLSKIYC